MKTSLIALSILAFLSCGPAGPDEKKCTRGGIEADLRIGALAGADVDASGKLKPGNYMLSSTYLKLSVDPKGQKAFRDAMTGINAILPTTPGLSAFSLATSEECLTARTLSVWKDQASMYSFVGTPAHANAVSQISTMSRGGGLVTHWADTEAGATFEKATEQLVLDVGPFF